MISWRSTHLFDHMIRDIAEDAFHRFRGGTDCLCSSVLCAFTRGAAGAWFIALTMTQTRISAPRRMQVTDGPFPGKSEYSVADWRLRSDRGHLAMTANPIHSPDRASRGRRQCPEPLLSVPSGDSDLPHLRGTHCHSLFTLKADQRLPERSPRWPRPLDRDSR
jgi:hypothetical protein